MSEIGTWMPLYVGDYLADTGTLTLEQHGAYLKLIMHYWRLGPLPDDEATLSRILAISTRKWRSLEPILRAHFLTLPDHHGYLHHKRIDAELAKAQACKDTAVRRAKRGAAARWYGSQIVDASGNASGNAPSNASSIRQAMLEQCSPPPPLPKEEPKPLAHPDGFAEFWIAYPKKKSKGSALKAWTKLRPDGELRVQILGAIATQRASAQWHKDGGQFIPHPASWLNARGWEDEPLRPIAERRRVAI
jgi:uncharacterized protein YdaU (DUF1376 family)